MSSVSDLTSRRRSETENLPSILSVLASSSQSGFSVKLSTFISGVNLLQSLTWDSVSKLIMLQMIWLIVRPISGLVGFVGVTWSSQKRRCESCQKRTSKSFLLKVKIYE